MRLLFLCISDGFALLIAACAPSATAATIAALGTLGGTSSYATAINDAGQVVGYSTNAAGIDHAFLYSGGVLNDLGTFGGTSSMAYGINNSGQIVGTVDFSYPVGSEAFLDSGGVGTIIGNANTIPFGPLSTANAINSSGQVAAVGIYYSSMSGPVTAGYLYSGGTSTYLPLPSGGTCLDLRIGAPMPCGGVVSAINDSGQVVGTVPGNYQDNAVDEATSYSGGLWTVVVPDLFYSGANGINNAGQIVGFYAIVQGSQYGAEDGGQDAFLLSAAGQFTDLGPGDALGINAQGQVVGYSGYVAGAPINTAFLYSGGMLINLNSLLPSNSGWDLQEATAINDSGQIVGYGTFDGETQAFLPNTAATVPEPCSLALLGAGAAFIFLTRRMAQFNQNVRDQGRSR
jgi:probable HAF family extracellular repeat protein